MSFHDKKGPAVSSGADQELLDTSNRDQNVIPADLSGPLSDLVRAGYDLIRLHGPKELNAEGESLGKVPLHRGWTREAATSAADAAAHLADGRNVGVRLNETQVVIDWDPRNDPAGTSLDRLCKQFGIETHPRVVTGSGGVHLYLKVPVGNYRWKLDGFDGLDFKGRGGFVVAPGSVHPVTGDRYRLELDPLDDDLFRDASAALVSALTRPERAEATGGGEIGPERLSELLSALDPKAYQDHGEWLSIMMASHHATAGAGRDEFVAWSLGDPDYADDRWIIERRWDSLRADNGGDRVTIGTLYKAVRASGSAHLVPADAEGAKDDFEGVEVEPVEGALAERPERMPVWVDRYNERFCVAPMGKEVYVFRDTLADDGARVWEPLSQSGFQAIYRHDQINAGTPEKPKMVPLPTLWLNHPRRRFAERVVFDPSRRQIEGALNTWRGWACKPEPGDWSLMQRVVREALAGGNQEHADYVLNWLAFGFQRPAELPRVALVFRGGKGVGKGSLGQTVHKIAVHHGLSVSGMSQVSGRFNAHLRQRVFVFADEVFASGDKEAESVLKRLITEPMLTYEAKGVDARNGDNYSKLILASNEEWVVPVSGDERRFAVFDVAPIFQGDRAFWDAVHRQLDAGGREAMLHDLLRRDIRGWHPTQVPQTQALIDQKTDSLAGFDRWWAAVLLSGRLPNGADWQEGALIDVAGKEAILGAANAEIRGPDLSILQLGKKVSAMGLDTKAHDKKGQRAWRCRPWPMPRRPSRPRPAAP